MARATNSTWVFDWCQTWDEVFDPGFVAQWKSLRRVADASTPYHEPAVVRAWAETCGKAIGCRPLFGVAARRDVTILLPWIIVVNRGRVVTRLTIEGVGQDLFGYHDPIVSGTSAHAVDWPEFWEAARNATAGFCHQALLRSVHAAYARSDDAPAENAPVLALDRVASLEAALARCSSNHRGEVHRRLRRLSEGGNVALHVFDRTEPRAAARAVEQLASAYETRRETRPQYPSSGQRGLYQLWARVATEGLADGWGHLSMLTVDGEPIAWHLGLFQNGVLYWWVPTHAERWEPWSPGKVLLAKLIEHGIASGWREVHFLTGAHAYKMAWRPDLPERRVIRWHSPTLAGALLKRYDRLAAV